MRIVFDEQNAISFFKNLQSNEFSDNVLNLLKRQVNLKFNFTLDEISEPLEMQILEFEEVGGRKKNKLTIEYGKRNTEGEFCVSNIEKNNDIYLLESLSQKIQNANKVLCGVVGEEYSVLTKLFPDVEEMQLHEQRLIGNNKFQNWDDISDFVRPFTSMVIVDRYMFKGPEIGGNLGLFDYNLKILLGKFYENQKSKTNLTFIYQIDPFPKIVKYKDEGPDLESLKRKVKNAVKSLNKNCPSPNINLIAVPKGKISDDHDRNIIIDYLRIKSGDTLVYFNSKGIKETNSNEFDVYSLARRQYRETTSSLLTKLKQIVNDTLHKFEGRCLVNVDGTADKIINLD
jgi:hypothetical protein